MSGSASSDTQLLAALRCVKIKITADDPAMALSRISLIVFEAEVGMLISTPG